MEIILTALDRELVDAWQKFCGDLPHVRVYQGSILDVECDAVVSPANSFGFMDGGIDMLYSNHFGWGIQKQLQKLIREKHFGELIVGAAEIVGTGNPAIPFLIAAPTMRVPMLLKETVNPYLAARATLLLVKYGTFPAGPYESQKIADRVKRVAFPGLGTGVGHVSPETCARQVRAAFEEVVKEKNVFPKTWFDAQTRHQRLYTDQVRDLQWE
ncbi:MAG: macro domain-containing protein [Chloroflexi bacterium]|nr:macro domain-containing protein [Chloroflexota bacterium]OJW05398.1 MAG: Appr-1-p processing protein [Chloroflexi bacterium 54-19]